MVQLDGYIRVSQVRGRAGDSFISPKVQRDQIEKWAALRDSEIVKFHTDLDQSGAKDNRPGLIDAIRRIEAGETEGLVVAKLDRFARSITSALEAINRIVAAGGVFISVADGIDPSTPAGKLQQNIMLVFAEFELDRIRENWNIAQRRAVARGVHIASKTPTGYKRRDDRRLEPDPRYAPHITEIFRMRASGDSWRDIGRYMDAHAVVGPYGATNWRTRAVQHIIANPAYLGEARSGSHVNPDAHEPLIDRATWEKAQSARSAPPATKNTPALLAGLVRCAGCRHVMKPDRMTGRDRVAARLYRCRGEHSTGTCQDRAASLGSVIEPWVEAQFFARIGDMRMQISSDAVSQTTSRLEAAEAELVAFRDSERLLSALGEERFVEGIEKRADDVNVARQELVEVQHAQGLAQLNTSGVSLEGLWPELAVEDKQKLLMSAIDAVMLRSGRSRPIRDRALVLWRGDAPDDLPRRGRRVPLRPFDWPPDGAGVAPA